MPPARNCAFRFHRRYSSISEGERQALEVGVGADEGQSERERGVLDCERAQARVDDVGAWLDFGVGAPAGDAQLLEGGSRVLEHVDGVVLGPEVVVREIVEKGFVEIGWAVDDDASQPRAMVLQQVKASLVSVAQT